jgi:hypothetical protein
MMTMFDNRVLKEIRGPKEEEITRERERLYKEEVYDLYSSLNFIRLIKSRRTRWTRCVGRRVERRGRETHEKESTWKT